MQQIILTIIVGMIIFYQPYSQPEPAAIESFCRTVKETRQAFLNR